MHDNFWAYGIAKNGSGMETGNGKWKWKLETELRQTLCSPILRSGMCSVYYVMHCNRDRKAR